VRRSSNDFAMPEASLGGGVFSSAMIAVLCVVVEGRTGIEVECLRK
jgi:hypothetical protein